MAKELRLQGKKTLVTGSDTGIGHEIGLEFARQGSDVVFHYVLEDSAAKSAVEEVKSMGRKSAAFQADFDALDQVTRLAEQAGEFLGGVNCLVNNAGVTMNRPFLKVAPEQFDKMFSINFRGPYFLTQKIVESMLQTGGGVICNMSSVHGLQGVPEHSVYAATKGAIIAYTRSLAVELAYKGIRVNAIAPGWITVENYFKCIPGFTQEMADETGYKAIPAARCGETVDVARLAAFLCSDDASFIVGQTIVCDGGTTALMSLVSDFRKESTNTFGRGYIPGV
ncbi:MAG TPA: glucose 1-dehydrogenase [Terriglobales bacterium]|jgi:NAD(P)-dependent dehydrogenase (short-subunit alcohol dehydrogenase family)|nr:glucose 1-dehydrogenase [Terriglobales bacterium]